MFYTPHRCKRHDTHDEKKRKQCINKCVYRERTKPMTRKTKMLSFQFAFFFFFSVQFHFSSQSQYSTFLITFVNITFTLLIAHRFISKIFLELRHTQHTALQQFRTLFTLFFAHSTYVICFLQNQKQFKQISLDQLYPNKCDEWINWLQLKTFLEINFDNFSRFDLTTRCDLFRVCCWSPTA